MSLMILETGKNWAGKANNELFVMTNAGRRRSMKVVIQPPMTSNAGRRMTQTTWIDHQILDPPVVQIQPDQQRQDEEPRSTATYQANMVRYLSG